MMMKRYMRGTGTIGIWYSSCTKCVFHILQEVGAERKVIEQHVPLPSFEDIDHGCIHSFFSTFNCLIDPKLQVNMYV